MQVRTSSAAAPGWWGWAQGASGRCGLACCVPGAVGISTQPPLLERDMGSHWALGLGVHHARHCKRESSASAAAMGVQSWGGSVQSVLASAGPVAVGWGSAGSMAHHWGRKRSWASSPSAARVGAQLWSWQQNNSVFLFS